MVAEIHRPEGRYLKMEYDEKGRVVKQRAPNGPDGKEVTIFHFEYKPKEYHTNVWDALDRKTSHYYSSQKRLTLVKKYDAQGHQLSSRHLYWGEANELPLGRRDKSDEGNLLATTIREGDDSTRFSCCYSYDDDGNVIKEALYGNLTGKGTKRFDVDKKGRPKDSSVEHYSKHFTYCHDQFHLLLSEWEEGGPHMLYQYKKGTDLCSAKFTCEGDTIRRREFYEYDEDAVLIRKVVDDGSTKEMHDINGITYRHITKITPVRKRSAHGIGQPEEVVEYYYDHNAKQELLLSKKRYSYNREGLVLTEEVYDGNNSLSYTLHNSYNNKGLCTSKTDALGHKWCYEYDDNFNKVREELVGSGMYTKYSFDSANRLVKEVEYHSDGNVFTKTFSYDAVGNMTSSSDRFGEVTRYEYDGLNRLVAQMLPKVVDATGAVHEPRVIKNYDLFGNVKEERDQNGHITTTHYTIRNQPYNITYPDGSTESFEYNVNGTLACHIDRVGTKTEYTYDFLGRVLTTKIFDSKNNLLSTTSDSYNSYHKIASTDAMGNTTKYSYDGAGRLVKQKKQVGDAVERTTYSYDALGRLHTTHSWNTGEDFLATVQERNKLDRVIEERKETTTGEVIAIKKYSYDIQGCLTDVISADSCTHTDYNSEGLPVRSTDALGNQTTIEYKFTEKNSLGQKALRKTTIDPMGNKTIELFDALGRVVSQRMRSSNDTRLAKREFFYDLKGNKTLDKEQVIVDGATVREYSVAFTYNEMGQVTTVTEQGEKSTSYSYCNGLLDAITKPDGVVLSHTYDGLSRLTKLASSDSSVSYQYSYDLNNNPIKVIDKSHSATYSYAYDGWNRKTKDALWDGCQINYSYDNLGRLTRYSLPTGSVDYSYAKGHLEHVVRKDPAGKELYRHSYTSFDLEERVNSCQLISGLGAANFIWDKLGRNVDTTTPYWSEALTEFDKAGNLLASSITDSAGTMHSRYEYDQLYQLTRESGPFEVNFRCDSLCNRVQKNDTSYQLNGLNKLMSDSMTQWT
ncbi:MAG: hypothetical protein ACRDF4_00770, partial [Rhabdochlamydiaceae bacterium]